MEEVVEEGGDSFVSNIRLDDGGFLCWVLVLSVIVLPHILLFNNI